MTKEEIKEILEIFTDSGMAEIQVKRGDNSLRIRRAFAPPPTAELVIPQVVTSTASPVHQHVMAMPTAGALPPSGQASLPPSPASEDIIVKSPIVGTYYESPKPGDAPFVRVGDQVEPGHVLCIIESMKLMNEIEAEVAGTVVGTLMENGRPVEYGEALFSIRPR